MQENIVKTFVKFLKTNNAFEQFSYNLIHDEKFRTDYGDDGEPSVYIDNKLKNSPIMIFMDGFSWSDTQEGVDFWDQINCLWINKLKK